MTIAFSPTVTVIVPCYNSARHLDDCLASVVGQSFQNWCLILVDDGSTDNSREIAKRWAEKDSRITCLEQSQNAGAGAARNRGLDAATGEYIAFLDADDRWHPDKLKNQLAFMHRMGSAFSCSAYVAERPGRPLRKISVPLKTNRRKLLRGNTIGCSTVIVKRTALADWRFPGLRRRQDFALWLSILNSVDYCWGLNETLSTYRIHDQSLSSDTRARLMANWALYRSVLGFSILRSSLYLGSHYVKALARRLISFLRPDH